MNTGDIKGRWKRFAEKIAEGQSATDAYLAVGYRPSTREVAHRAASRLRAQPAIRVYIQNLRETADQEAREDTTLTIREKLAFLARIVKTSAASLAEDDELIQSHRILKDGRASTRIPCKLKALKMHSELAGHLAPVRPEPTPPVDTLQLFFDQIRAGRILTDPEPCSEPPSSPATPSSKNTPFTPSVKDRPGIAETNHRSRHTHPAPSAPRANAEEAPSQQVSQTQQNSTISPPGDNRTDPSDQVTTRSEPRTTTPWVQATATQSTPIEPYRPSLPTETAQATTYPPPTLERASKPTAPPPVCQLNTEPLKTPPSSPLTPTQVRKLELAQLRQNSSSHHYQPIIPSPPPPPRVIRP